MKNTGLMPDVVTCDIKFRNGKIARAVDPTKFRWEPFSDGPSSYDIVEWQSCWNALNTPIGKAA